MSSQLDEPILRPWVASLTIYPTPFLHPPFLLPPTPISPLGRNAPLLFLFSRSAPPCSPPRSDLFTPPLARGRNSIATAVFSFLATAKGSLFVLLLFLQKSFDSSSLLKGSTVKVSASTQGMGPSFSRRRMCEGRSTGRISPFQTEVPFQLLLFFELPLSPDCWENLSIGMA